MNAIIQTTTGDLLRAGFCDFTNDGSFDGATETERADVPYPVKVKGAEGETEMHRWNGSAWILVAQP